jgi:hypothetical protein
VHGMLSAQRLKLAMRHTMVSTRHLLHGVERAQTRYGQDKAKYLARLGTKMLRNGNELECSSFTITPSSLKQKFLRSPTRPPALPHKAEAPLEEEYPKAQGTIFIQKNKKYQENTVKHNIYIYIYIYIYI